jgi:hypothetical protein
MMLWPNRAAAWLKRLGVWRVIAFAAALLLLWLVLQGPRDPSPINIRRF